MDLQDPSWVNLLSSWNSADSAKPSMTANCGDTPYPPAMAAPCLAHPQSDNWGREHAAQWEDSVVGLGQDRETYGCPLATRRAAEMDEKVTVHQLRQPALPNSLPLLGSVFWALKGDWDLFLWILCLCPLRAHEKLPLCTASQCPCRLLPLWWGCSLWLLLLSGPLVPLCPHRLTSRDHTGGFLAILPKDGRKSARNGKEESERKRCIPQLCRVTPLSWSFHPIWVNRQAKLPNAPLLSVSAQPTAIFPVFNIVHAWSQQDLFLQAKLLHL